MPNNFILSPLANLDLDSIRGYITLDNPVAAKKLIIGIFEIFNHLANNPLMGHSREDLTDKPVKFFSVKHYMIIYDHNSKPIRILRILSSYRDIPSILN